MILVRICLNVGCGSYFSFIYHLFLINCFILFYIRVVLQVGDGEDVRLLAANLQPWAIFLDFDRTLATTRGGGSPLVQRMLLCSVCRAV
jgi:hypothetical protein